MTVRVLGIGQPAAGDDGVGLVVLEKLRRQHLPDAIELGTVAEPSGLLSLLEAADHVVLVDAVLGGTPGEVLQLDAASLAGANVVPLSTHGVGVAQALALARVLAPGSMPDRIDIVGICIEPPTVGQIGLSDAVAAAVPRAVLAVEEILGLRAANPGGGSCTNPLSPNRS